jgi:hypothetical protein
MPQNRRGRCLGSSLALFSAFLALSWAGAAGPAGAIQGQVRDATGAILPGAAILIQHWHWGGLNGKSTAMDEPLLYADSAGRFAAQLPPGLYDVLISYPSLAPFVKRIAVKSGERTVLDCELAANPLVKSVE